MFFFRCRAIRTGSPCLGSGWCFFLSSTRNASWLTFGRFTSASLLKKSTGDHASLANGHAVVGVVAAVAVAVVVAGVVAVAVVVLVLCLFMLVLLLLCLCCSC